MEKFLDPSLLITKPKALTQADKKLLRESGIIVVEADHPDEVRFLKPHNEISGSAMFYSAMEAIAKGADGKTKTIFFDQVAVMCKASNNC